MTICNIRNARLSCFFVNHDAEFKFSEKKERFILSEVRDSQSIIKFHQNCVVLRDHNLLQLMNCKIVTQCITINGSRKHFYTFKDFNQSDSLIQAVKVCFNSLENFLTISNTSKSIKVLSESVVSAVCVENVDAFA